MADTVINIYGTLHIDVMNVTMGEFASDQIMSAITRSIQNQSTDKVDCVKNDKMTSFQTQNIPKSQIPCYDHYGRWSNEAERDAWRRFYRANS